MEKFLCTTAAFPLSLSDHLWHAITANDGDDDDDDDDDDNDDDDCVGDDDDDKIDDQQESFDAQWCSLSLSLLLHLACH